MPQVADNLRRRVAHPIIAAGVVALLLVFWAGWADTIVTLGSSAGTALAVLPAEIETMTEGARR